MHPVLFSVFGLPIRTYGMMLVIGFLTAQKVIEISCTKNNVNKEKMLELVSQSFIVGLIGAKVLYILTQFNSFVEHPKEILQLWNAGFVFFGGFLAVIPFMIWYAKKHQLPYAKILDLGTLGLVIAHGIGRIGCFFAGCCYGKPTNVPWGVIFHQDSAVEDHLQNIPLHPTQLYEALSLGILFAVLFWIFNKRKKFDGQIALLYLIFYPIIRSIIEIFRGDTIRGFVIPNLLSTSQFISLGLFLIGCVGFIYQHKRAR